MKSLGHFYQILFKSLPFIASFHHRSIEMNSLLFSSLLLASTTFGMPAPQTPATVGVPPSDWLSKQCTDQYLNDAAAQPALRWNAAAADHAWNSVELAWNQEPPPAGDVPLPFSAYVSNYFHSKDRLACENLAENPCDDTVLCTDVNHPAGFLIINSFVAIHDVSIEILRLELESDPYL